MQAFCRTQAKALVEKPVCQGHSAIEQRTLYCSGTQGRRQHLYFHQAHRRQRSKHGQRPGRALRRAQAKPPRTAPAHAKAHF